MKPRTRWQGAGGVILATLALGCLASTGRASVLQTRSLLSAAGQVMSNGPIRLGGNFGEVLVGPSFAGATQLWGGFWAPATTGPSAVELPSGVPGCTLGLPRPNPAARLAVIDFSVPQESTGSLTIFDSQGRVVRRLFHGTSEPGATRLIWDLRTDSGHAVPDGIYFYRLQLSTIKAGGKLTVLR